MDLKEIAEAYQLVYEKKKLDPVGKEDDDVDNDGDVDSSDEYLKKRRAAIGKAMGKDDDKKDDDKEEDDEDSKGLSKGQKKLPPQLQKAIAKKSKKNESLDLVSAYHSMYEHHQKDADGNVIPHEDKEEVKEGIDLSFVDELSEEELDTLVEEVVYDLIDEGVELDAIEGAFTVYLEEAKITFGSDTPGEDEEVGTKTRSKKNPTPEEKKTAALKKRKEEKAKASKEKTEKLKKSIGKAVTKMKAKMHGGMSKYASKRKLIPTNVAKKAAATPERVAPAEPKGKSKKAQREFEMQKKGVEMANKSRAEKMKGTKRTQDINRSLGKKESRKELRSAVFKDVKDRVGKKVKSVADAPKKASERVQSFVKKGRQKIGRGLEKGTNVLGALAKKMQEQGGELDMFDTVTAYLIDEGLVKDFDQAQRVMSTLDSTLIEEVHAEQIQLLKEYGGSTDKPMLVTNADKKGNTPAYQNMMKGMKSKVTGKPMYMKADHMESLEDAYLKVYEEKSTGDKLKDIAKKKQAKYDAQPQEYKNNPAFGDESHHSNAKNK